MKHTIRKINAYLLCPFMKVTGFSFSKDYRWEITRFHSVVYNCVDTVGANWLAHGKKMRENIKETAAAIAKATGE